jgi:hypothetical protein
VNRIALIFAAAALLSSQAHAAEQSELATMRAEIGRKFAGKFKVLSVCGESTGKSLVQGGAAPGWQDDSAPSERLIFIAMPNGNRDVMFSDASGDIKSSAAGGAVIREVYSKDANTDFVWTVAYPATGMMEVFNVTLRPTVGPVVTWTTSRPGVVDATTPSLTLGPKVAAYVANCA